MSDRRTRRYFVAHMQKTAGTTLRDRLRASFTDDEIYPNRTDGPDPRIAVISVEHLQERWAVRGGEIRLLTGHFPVRTVELLDLRRAPFVTMTVLRDPVDRTLSFLRHQAERRQRGATADTPLEEIYDDPFRFEAMIQNHMTRHAVARTRRDGTGRRRAHEGPVHARTARASPRRRSPASTSSGCRRRFEEFCGELGDPVRPRRRRTAADEHDRSRATSRPASPNASRRTTRSTSSSMSTLARSTKRAGHGRLVACTAQHRWKHERTHGFRDEQGHPRRSRRARRRWACARRHRPARTSRSPPTPTTCSNAGSHPSATRRSRSSSRCRRSAEWPVPVDDLDRGRGAHPGDHAATTSTRAWSDATSSSHGSVLVRGLLDAEQVARFTAGIDRALAARERRRRRLTRARRRPGTSRCRSPADEAVVARPQLGRRVGWHARGRFAEAVATAVLDLRRRSGCATSSASTSASARSSPRTSARCGACRSRRTPTGTRTVRSSAKESAR